MANQKSLNDIFIGQLNDIIDSNIQNEDFGVSELAREMGMSRSTLHRRVSKITGKTVIALISEARLKRAMELLKEGTYTVSEVSWKAGFGSVTYFNRCFHDFYGFPPGEARNRDLAKIPKDISQKKEYIAGNLKNRKRILAIIVSLLVLISAIIVLILIKPFSREHNEIEKSIAVLPFRLLSDEPDKQYLADGIMDAIVMHLSTIKDLRVPSVTSTQQYRETSKTMVEIAKELGVNYLLEGSFQKDSDDVRLIVQLIFIRSKKEGHIWQQYYDRQWDDIFSVQSEVAQAIANELKAIISYEEKQLIEKKPTANMDAYNLVLQGGELSRIGQTANDTNLVMQAGDYFRKAILLDSTFANAYVMLGWNINGLRNDYDSAFYFANRALHFDDKNAGAYGLKGSYFLWHGGEDKLKEAEDAYRLAIKYNPNTSSGYSGLGDLYQKLGDYSQWIKYKLKALNLEKDPWMRWNILRFLTPYLNKLGYFDEALIFSKELITINNDSLDYYYSKPSMLWSHGDYDSAYNIARIAIRYKKMADDITPLNLAYNSIFIRDYPSALKHVEEYIDEQEQKGVKVTPNALIGFVYMKNGEKEKAAYHFDGCIRNQLNRIEKSQPSTDFWNYFNLTSVYSAMGEKEKALAYLREAKKCRNAGSVTTIYNPFSQYKDNPMYETILNEPEFQEFLEQIENRYHTDREKIKKLFREAEIYN